MTALSPMKISLQVSRISRHDDDGPTLAVPDEIMASNALAIAVSPVEDGITRSEGEAVLSRFGGLLGTNHPSVVD